MTGVKGFRCELSENNSQGSGRKFLWDFWCHFWVTNVMRMIQTGSYLANKAKMSTTNESFKSSTSLHHLKYTRERACVRACVRVYVRVYVCVSVCVCVCVCVCVFEYRPESAEMSRESL